MTRSQSALLGLALLVLAILAAVVGVLYLHDTAHALPSFLPGHANGHGHGGTYTKRGVAGIVVAVLLLLGAAGSFVMGRRQPVATR